MEDPSLSSEGAGAMLVPPMRGGAELGIVALKKAEPEGGPGAPAAERAEATGVAGETSRFREAELHDMDHDLMDRDLAERKRMEQAMRESEALLRAVVNTAVDGILTLSEDGTIQSVNPAAEAIFGYAADELVGRNIRVLVCDEEEYEAYLSDHLKAGVKRKIGRRRELCGRRSDGSSFPMDVSISDVEVGERRLFTVIVRDVTQQRELEREVMEISAREQQRIGYDLHDGLGQELTGIASLASVLSGRLGHKAGCDEEAEEAGEITDLANRAVAHTRALVRGLCPVRLEDDGLMTSLMELAENVEYVHGCKCSFECDEPVLVPDYDVSMHLYYIVTEAVSNAVRHGKARHIRITLRADGERGLLTVGDDGVGLGEDTRREAGRGMHIMRYRARIVGGSLYLRNRGGGGTIVACTFDLKKNAPANPPRNQMNPTIQTNQPH